MQIMNLGKLVKDFWWVITSFRTIDELPDAIIYVNYKGDIRNYNRKAKDIFSLNSDDNITTNLDDIIKNGNSLLNLSLKNRKPVLGTANVIGREFFVELNASNKLGGYCLSIRNLTKLTNELVNEDKIARFNNEKNAMLTKLEGDIKSPITSISGFSRGLLDGLGGQLTEKQAKYVKIINSNAEDLYHFMDKFLEFSKAESSLYETNYHNFDIIDTLKNVAKDFDGIISEKKLSFDINYENLEKRTIFSDSNSIKSAFRNLLEVSLGMTETGFIKVKLQEPDEETCKYYKLDPQKRSSYLHIKIKDTGAGIAEEDMKYLCEPYAQLEKGKKNFLKAIELGSASILIKRIEGIIDIHSELMKGTRYDIILPIEKGKNE